MYDNSVFCKAYLKEAVVITEASCHTKVPPEGFPLGLGP